MMFLCYTQVMRDVSVETFLEYVRTSNLEAIEATIRQCGYDIDSQDDVSTVSQISTCRYPGMHLVLSLFHVKCFFDEESQCAVRNTWGCGGGSNMQA